MKQAVEDGCKRLLMPSMETEMRLAGKKAADETAIRVFADNLRELLLASPLGRKRTLAIDPGFRTGCKTVALDTQGEIAKSFGDVKLTPTTYVIDKQGNIIKRYIGEPEFASLHQLLEKALAA